MAAQHSDLGNSPTASEAGADLLIVGIGASAGGITALRRFFSHVSPDSGAAYAVVLHLSPDYDSKLAEILQTTTTLPITQVRGRLPVKPDQVYVIPPNASLTISDGHIVATEVAGAEERRGPVDMFFRTLADSHGQNAVAVVLSGTGPNGSSGLKRVKERGGLAIAQDPGEAEYGDMPRNSIATGLVDCVLPVDEIPGKILEYYARLQKARPAGPTADSSETDADALREILTLLRTRTGHDFSNYKPSTILRRIGRRVSLLGRSTFAEYVSTLRQQPDEAAALMKELLITVTNFFRDPEAYAALEQSVVPRIFAGKRSLDQVRVWVAGCATGEEAYSIAMLLVECATGLADQPRIQVFASDLDERAIAVAREGFYTDAESADVSVERLQRFFHRETGGYRVRRELRELVLFAQHNLIRDPPFSHLDLLTCRNVLIYLNRSIQERLLETFHFALRPGGYLFLGTSESPEGVSDLFAAINKDAHMYESRTGASRLILPATEVLLPAPARIERQSSAPALPERVIPIDLHHRLLEEYAAPSLVVTDEHMLVHVSDRAGRYLQISRGAPSRDILQLVHPDLRAPLRTALFEALRQRANVAVRAIQLTTAEAAETIDLLVRPVLRSGDPARGFFLIVIEKVAAPAIEPDVVHVLRPVDGGDRHLEDELVRMKAQLNVTVEQYETQVEEGRAANEEMQAANEELRSSAEELETSKEELQSLNEELTTVNQELKIKIEELRLTNNDFQNFINATSIPTIFLDRQLRVKFSTARAQEVFNLLPSDVDRPLSDITSKITDEGILDEAKKVLEQLQTAEREVHTRDRRSYLMRILPYRTLDDRIEGVVITFVDVTGLRQAEAAIFASEVRLRLLIEGATEYAIFTMNNQGTIDSWNFGAERLFGYTSKDVVGENFSMLLTEADRSAGVAEEELARARRDGRAMDGRYHQRQDGTTFYASGVTARLGEGPDLGFAKIARDLTAQREASDALNRLNAGLEERVRARTADLQEEQHRVKELLRRLVTAQEDQSARIARDMHDQLGQQLTTLRLTLERGQQSFASRGDVDTAFASGLELTSSISHDLNFLAWVLRPVVLDDLGLGAALPRFFHEWSSHYGIRAEFRTAGLVAGQLSKDQELAYYRIAQESLNNVLKHSHASRVDVVLETRDGSVNLIIADDGVGFEPASAMASDAPGFGLIGMEERAALVGISIEIESTPGHGTTIYLRTPVQSPDGTAT